MPIQNCPLHGFVENVICCEGQCIRRYCSQCFQLHNPQHTNGVIFNQASKDSLIQWNTFLMDKFKQILNCVTTKGYSTIFELRLNVNYPKGLIGQINNAEITEVAIKVIEDYLQTLATNIQFISTRQTLEELDIPELFKDLFIFFFYDTGNGLNFLAQKIQEELKLKFYDKKIYQFVEFILVPKQLRLLEVKRKTLVNKLQQTAIMRLKKGNGQASPKVKIDKESPRKNVLLSNMSRMKSYNENSNPSSLTNLEVLQKSTGTHPSIFSPQPKIQTHQIAKKLQEQFKDEVRSSNTIQQQQQKRQNNIQQPNNNKIQQQVNGQIRLNIDISNKKQMEEGLENQKLKIQIYRLKQKLKEKERSISALNKLIGNQQQQLQFRQNQVQILSEQIRKLIDYKQKYESNQIELEKTKDDLKLKQRSINELHKLIGNEEEQLQFRQSEVQTLTNEIKKLVQFKQKYEQTEQKLTQKQKQLDLREKGIKELNNVISNQEQQLAFRENEVQMLTTELKKAQQSKIEIQKKLQQVVKDHEQLKKQISEKQLPLPGEQSGPAALQNNKTFDEQLMDEVIQLQTEVVIRNQDVKTLVEILNSIQSSIPAQKKAQTVERLKKLKTVRVQI